MAVVQRGLSMVWRAPPPGEEHVIMPLPPGQLKLRFRHDRMPMLYARHNGVITKYYLRDFGYYWVPMLAGDSNMRLR